MAELVFQLMCVCLQSLGFYTKVTTPLSEKDRKFVFLLPSPVLLPPSSLLLCELP